MTKLVLLRHGESTWNLENRFTGWTDVDLTPKGVAEAHEAARLLMEAGLHLRRGLHLAAEARHPHPVDRPGRHGPDVDPRPSELAPQRAALRRPAGPEQGGDGGEVRRRAGADLAPQLLRRRLRRSPPTTSAIHPHDPRYADLAPDELPLAESLKDTVARFLPYWHECIAPAVREGKRVLIAAHGNSLRALVKYLDEVSEEEIVELNIPTGIPLVYELDKRPEADPPLLPRRPRSRPQGRGGGGETGTTSVIPAPARPGCTLF